MFLNYIRYPGDDKMAGKMTGLFLCAGRSAEEKVIRRARSFLCSEKNSHAFTKAVEVLANVSD